MATMMITQLTFAWISLIFLLASGTRIKPRGEGQSVRDQKSVLCKKFGFLNNLRALHLMMTVMMTLMVNGGIY